MKISYFIENGNVQCLRTSNVSMKSDICNLNKYYPGWATAHSTNLNIYF